MDELTSPSQKIVEEALTEKSDSSLSDEPKPQSSEVSGTDKEVADAFEANASAVSAKSMSPSSEVAGTEHRQAYGTAKTENLRDSGAWRIILPGFVALLCLSLFAVPLIILINLLVGSFDPNAATHSLTWLWITMIVLSVCIAAVISWGLIRIFMTQAGNYKSV